jgi:hypothetical protein
MRKRNNAKLKRREIKEINKNTKSALALCEHLKVLLKELDECADADGKGRLDDPRIIKIGTEVCEAFDRAFGKGAALMLFRRSNPISVSHETGRFLFYDALDLLFPGMMGGEDNDY